ncbi:hypothetical protein [Microbacterium xanthum]|uniref:hypothetical protein n=1 Tax=Microbacterium xanthum TaxID=3079794 RepID=UPI002AD20815|nr:hypothetical protein [Microbacterium sp. KSW-48]MDZ8171545.1 hypothetical protein [Microbacterium sp. KSW-48]
MESGIEPPALRRFVAHTESKVSPKAVAALYSRAEILARMPSRAQRWIVSHARGDDGMGFIVEPYCFFLAYEITDPDAATRLLPPHYRLAPTAMFADETPRLCAIVGAFTLHTSVFWGARVELYVIAEDTRSGMLTWLICDYESNTINYGPGEGFAGATTDRAVITTTHAGEVVIDVRSAQRPNRLELSAPVHGAAMAPLDQRLWIEGNLSVDYGGRLQSDGSDPFGLVFDPDEMRQALRIDPDAVALAADTFGAAFRSATPFEAACFPYAQHFLTSSFSRPTTIRDRAGLERAVRERSG